MSYKNIIFSFVFLASAVAVGYLMYNKDTNGLDDDRSFLARVWDSVSPSEEQSKDTDEPLSNESATQPAYTHEGDQYTNTMYGFSFELPSEYTTQVNPLWDDSDILTFDAGEEKSFQIFITPHDEPFITPERIKIDVPDIVMNNIRTAMLDSTEALVFESRDSSLGETYEIWFVHNDHLYQIMTYAENENELNGILGTWKFQ